MSTINTTNQWFMPNYFSSFEQDLDQNLFLSLSPKELLALSSTSREWRQRVLSTTHSIAEQIFRTWDLSECQGSLGGFRLLLLYQKAKRPEPHFSPMSVPLSIIYEERNSEITDDLKTTMLAFACISQSLQSCHILLKNGASLNPSPDFHPNISPVVIAAHTGNVPILNALIDHGTDQESLNEAFCSMLRGKLTFSGTVVHVNDIIDVNHEICKLLLKKGAYPLDSIISPVHFLAQAVLNKDVEFCQLLIDHYGAAVYDRNYSVYLGTIDDCLFERSYHSSRSLREHYGKCYQIAKILFSQKTPTLATLTPAIAKFLIMPAVYAVIFIAFAWDFKSIHSS